MWGPLMGPDNDPVDVVGEEGIAMSCVPKEVNPRGRYPGISRFSRIGIIQGVIGFIEREDRDCDPYLSP